MALCVMDGRLLTPFPGSYPSLSHHPGWKAGPDLAHGAPHWLLATRPLTCHVLRPCQATAWIGCPVGSTQACDLSRVPVSPSAPLRSPAPGPTPNQSRARPELCADAYLSCGSADIVLPGPPGLGPPGGWWSTAQHSIIHSFGKSAPRICGVPRRGGECCEHGARTPALLELRAPGLVGGGRVG